MKKNLCFLTMMVLFLNCSTHAQFTFNDVIFWIGSGNDSTILVVDFHDSDLYSTDSSYAWGYLHGPGATAEDMLNAVAEADINFTIDAPGGFLNDIVYGVHEGLGGTEGYYWSTWSGNSVAGQAMNNGISTAIGSNDFFACSFTDWDPEAVPAGEPIAAFDPEFFTEEDVEFWVGEGDNSAVIVVDFLDGSATHSYAWGYHFDGEATGEDALNAIAAADPAFTVDVQGFLNNINYAAHSGVGGEPNYWGTWSGTNLGNWYTNSGVAEILNDGDFFGCSYTDFAPALRPSYPEAASFSTGVDIAQKPEFETYPNPARETVFVERESAESAELAVYDMLGRKMQVVNLNNQVQAVSVAELPAGYYIFKVAGSIRKVAVK